MNTASPARAWAGLKSCWRKDKGPKGWGGGPASRVCPLAPCGSCCMMARRFERIPCISSMGRGCGGPGLPPG